VTAKLMHLPQVWHDGLAEGGAPLGVRVGPDAEQLMTQREAGRFQLRIVQPEAGLEDREVLVEPPEGIRQTRTAGHRIAVVQLANRSLANDVREKVASGAIVVAEEIQLIVVGAGREEDIARGEIELGAIFLQGFISEGAEGHVPITVLLRSAGGTLAED